jgi:hypothetical protein
MDGGDHVKHHNVIGHWSGGCCSGSGDYYPRTQSMERPVVVSRHFCSAQCEDRYELARSEANAKPRWRSFFALG